MGVLEIQSILVWQDNYVHLLHDKQGGALAAVDPPEAGSVLDVLALRSLKLSHILITHHHPDHIGGIEELKAATGCRVVGARADAHRIPGLDVLVGDGDRVRVGRAEAVVMEVPGHTSGHIAYWFADERVLLCGDTLFGLGCGRLFEGSPADMWTSLLDLRALPDTAQVYCAHEYTEANARFALTIEPDNAALRARADEVRRLRAEGKPTVPSSMGLEKTTNPFLRGDVPALQAALGLGGRPAVEVFAEVRRRKDVFR